MKVDAQKQQSQPITLFVADEKRNRKVNGKTNDMIEPWLDEPQTLTHFLLNTSYDKQKVKQLGIKKHASMQMIPKNLIISPKKIQRPAKSLPKMNIGNFSINKIKRNKSLPREGEKKVQTSRSTLPTLAISRQLAIERKLFLMTHSVQKQPQNHKNLRQMIDARLHRRD